MKASRSRIVLASRSPRRRELAAAAGWDVDTIEPPERAEAEAAGRGADERLEAYVMRLARVKAEAVVAAGAVGTILACDTLGEIEGESLGKPVDEADARRMLERLSGRTHRVLTGVCLWQWPAAVDPIMACDESILAMDHLSDAFLQWYLASGLWRGKAGACGFQDERLPLRLISGSPSNVVGLPVELIGRLLERLGGR